MFFNLISYFLYSQHILSIRQITHCFSIFVCYIFPICYVYHCTFNLIFLIIYYYNLSLIASIFRGNSYFYLFFDIYNSNFFLCFIIPCFFHCTYILPTWQITHCFSIFICYIFLFSHFYRCSLNSILLIVYYYYLSLISGIFRYNSQFHLFPCIHNRDFFLCFIIPRFLYCKYILPIWQVTHCRSVFICLIFLIRYIYHCIRNCFFLLICYHNYRLITNMRTRIPSKFIKSKRIIKICNL